MSSRGRPFVSCDAEVANRVAHCAHRSLNDPLTRPMASAIPWTQPRDKEASWKWRLAESGFW